MPMFQSQLEAIAERFSEGTWMEPLMWLSWGVLCSVLSISVITDLRYRRILNIVTLPAMAVGLLVLGWVAVRFPRFEMTMSCIAALFLSLGFCILMERGSVWAAGDSKLFLTVTVWMVGFSPPLVGIALLIGFSALIHVGGFVVQRLRVWWRIPRVWGIVRFQPLPSGPAWQYPGSITIAAASLFTFLFNAWMWSGRGFG